MFDRLRQLLRFRPAASATQISFDQWQAYFAGSVSDAGPVISDRTAMSVSAVYSCVGLISGALAGLPLNVYRETDAGRQRIKPDLWYLLNQEASPMWSAASFWEYISWSRLLHGDGYARIIRPGPKLPGIVGFEPVHPLSVQAIVNGNRLVYTLTRDDGSPEIVDQDDMLHFTSPGFDGRRSLSPIQYALRNPVGIAIASDQYSASFFRNGARPDFAITSPVPLTDEKIKQLRESWVARYGGATNSHLPAVLTHGMGVTELTMSAEDSQLIATRAFQVEDIARIFGVPPFMIGYTEKTTSWGAGVEQMGIAFVKYTLQRHLTKIEQEINRKVFRMGRNARNFVEFNVDGLMRGDSKSRAEYYRAALGGSAGPGWMTQDEVRALENQELRGGSADVLTQWSVANGAGPTETPS